MFDSNQIYVLWEEKKTLMLVSAITGLLLSFLWHMTKFSFTVWYNK